MPKGSIETDESAKVKEAEADSASDSEFISETMVFGVRAVILFTVPAKFIRTLPARHVGASSDLSDWYTALRTLECIK